MEEFKERKEFYDPSKLLSMRDSQGKKPELLFVVGNREGGKTYGFKRHIVRLCLRRRKQGEYKHKFVLFVRNKQDVKDKYMPFFADIRKDKRLKYYTMSQEPLLKGSGELFLTDNRNGEKFSIGYVLALKDADNIKENSSLFSECCIGFMDEFVKTTGSYLTNEIMLFNTARGSIGRAGGGKEAKTADDEVFQVLLCCNNITFFNPYFDYYGIGKKLTDRRAKFVKGKGWVCERAYIKEAAEHIKAKFSSFSDAELKHAADNETFDRDTFVTKLKGNFTPILNIVYNNQRFALVRQDEVYFMRDKAIEDIPHITFTISDHDENNLIGDPLLLKNLIKLYNKNQLKFQSMRCKYAFYDICRFTDR